MQLSLNYEVFRCIHGMPWITGYIASWLILGLSLISKFLVASIAIYLITAASDWPRLFLHPGCFCLAYKCLALCSFLLKCSKTILEIINLLTGSMVARICAPSRVLATYVASSVLHRCILKYLKCANEMNFRLCDNYVWWFLFRQLATCILINLWASRGIPPI